MIKQITPSCVRLMLMCCCVLLLTKGTGVSPVRKLHAYVGEAVKAFTNTSGQCKEVSMYTKEEIYIATWLLKDDVPEGQYMNPDYKGMICMDRTGNVWFLNVKKTDIGNYCFKCGTGTAHLDVELIVLDNVTDEVENTKRLEKQEVIMILDNLTEEVKKITKGIDNQEVIMKHLDNLTEEVKKITKGIDNQEVIMKHLGGSHSETDQKITAILVIVIFLLFIIIWLAYNMWKQHKTKKKPLTEDQVQKWLYELTDFMQKNLEKLTNDQIKEQIQKYLDAHVTFLKKNLDQHDRIEDHHTSSLQESPIFQAEDLGVEKSCLEDDTGGKENQKKGISEISFNDTKDMISLLEMKSGPDEQPERKDKFW